jgi:Exportin 1-like protein
VLVVLLKHEWNGLFKDFVANFASLDNYNPHKLINNFRLLQAVIAEGFASWDHTVTTAQRDAFRASIDNHMRDILKIVVRTLRDDRPANR